MPSKSVILSVLATTIVLMCSTTTARADSWNFPTGPYDLSSDDGQHVLRIVPTDDHENGKARIEMLRTQQQGQEPLWSCNLRDGGLPFEVRLAPDGRSAVLLDHIGWVGYSEVVTICSERGVVAEYTLAQVMGLTEDELREITSGFSQNAPFSSSTSSRWWRAHAMDLLDETSRGPCFSLWLPYDPGWVVFDLSTGQMVKPTNDETARWNKRLRERAVQALAKTSGTYFDYGFNWDGDGPITAMRFLASLHDPVDRPVLENLLAYPWYSTSMPSISNGEREWREFSFYSTIRRAAVPAWACWNGKSGNSRPRYDDVSDWHGEITVEVELPVAPRATDGYLDLYLIEHTGSLFDVNGLKVKHCARIKFADWITDDESARDPDDWQPDKRIPIQWNLVLPGVYWVKAVWNRSGVADEDELDPTVKIEGDFHSTEIKLFRVVAGLKTKARVVRCDTAIKPTQTSD